MKKALLILIVAITGFYVSCKKDPAGPVEIYGKWRLIATMTDPGDGSGKYRAVTGPAKYLNINQSGKMEGEAIPHALSYRLLDSLRMEITTKSYAEPMIYYYKVSSNILILNPPCIEGCGLRFIRN